MSAATALRVNGALMDEPSDVSTDAIFPIYSITKTLTAICALRLLEEGALRLETPAREWLPDVAVPDTIQLQHLLQHTSGLRCYGPLPEYHRDVRAHPDRPWTRQQFLDAVLPHGLLFEPGASWSYSNVGYMLAIDALERAGGQTFSQLIHRHVSQPLGLTQTTVLRELDDLMICTPGFSTELTDDRRVVDVRGRYHPGWCAPRVVASTAAETTRIFDALLTGELLGADALARMLTLVPLPESDNTPPSIGGGLGVYRDLASPYGRNYCQGGGGPGYALSACIHPDTARGRVAVATFVNEGGPPPRDLESETLGRFLRTS